MDGLRFWKSDEIDPDEPKDDPTQGDTVGKIKVQTDSTKLKQFLNNLGTE